jgi:hypothetical protein
MLLSVPGCAWRDPTRITECSAASDSTCVNGALLNACDRVREIKESRIAHVPHSSPVTARAGRIVQTASAQLLSELAKECATRFPLPWSHCAAG